MTDWRALCEELAHEVEQYAEDRGDLMPECAERARAALAEPDEPTLQLPEQAPDEHPPSNLDRREVAAWYHGHACGWQAARAALARVALAAEPLVKGPTDEELLELARAELNNSPNWEEPEYDASNPFPYEAPGVAWLNFARAVLARFGHQPAPPADGEVGEVAAWLRAYCNEEFAPLSIDPDVSWLTRAADPLEQRHPTPVPVSERLPGDQLCWWFEVDEDCGYGSNWTLLRIRGSATGYTHWLPATALPLPAGEVE